MHQLVQRLPSLKISSTCQLRLPPNFHSHNHLPQPNDYSPSTLHPMTIQPSAPLSYPLNLRTMTIHYSVNGERFSGLNYRGFHLMKFFTGKVSQCLSFKALKQCHYTKLVYINKYSCKNFCSILENHKKHESLAQ